MEKKRDGIYRGLEHYLVNNADMVEVQVYERISSIIKDDIVITEDYWHQLRSKGVGRKVCVGRLRTGEIHRV